MYDYQKIRDIYDQVVACCPEIERKGKTMPYTSDNGHMFSQLNKDGEIGIRLSKEDGAEFQQKYNTGPFKSYGAVMKGYVLIPEELLSDKDALSAILKKGHEYVLSLPSK